MARLSAWFGAKRVSLTPSMRPRLYTRLIALYAQWLFTSVNGRNSPGSSI